MKKLIFFLISSVFILAGCNKDELEDNTEYYVRYDVSCQFIRHYGSYRGSSIKVSGTGVRTSEVEDKYTSFVWSDTAGPFKCGDRVSLSVKAVAPKGASYKTDAKISVCKSACPFVTKCSANRNGSVSLIYTIE